LGANWQPQPGRSSFGACQFTLGWGTMREKQSELSTARTAGLSYAGLGAVFGFAASVITFIACWTYCITAYDFVLGVGFGWIPAALCAGIIGWSVFFLWGGAVLFLVIAGVFVVAAAANPNMVIALAIEGLCGWLAWRFSPSWPRRRP
jgi:hypothetical protein